MAIPPSGSMYPAHAYKRRRTATAVLASQFDARPPRDVLTSVLNGVPVYEAVEKAEIDEERRARRREKRDRERDRDKDKRRAKSSSKAPERQHIVPTPSAAPPSAVAAGKRPQQPAVPRVTPTATSSFWQARPNIQIQTLLRSASVTPPPMRSSPPTTPDPSLSSATSATSSKRPHTPDDGEELTDRGRSVGSSSPPPESVVRPPRKKRLASRKGWKGWVEGSPPPSEKLINLDVVPILGERKTRSGKSFDAIGVGKDSWV